MDEPTFQAALHRARPLWTRERLLGVVAGTLATAARLLVSRSGPAPAREPRVDGRQAPPVVLTVGVEGDEDVAAAKPTLERLLELTLALRDGYDSQSRLVSVGAFDEFSLTCREHARRQTVLAKRIAARLCALGSPVELSACVSSPAASGVSAAPTKLELRRLLAAHRAISDEAKALSGGRAGAVWTTQELVVADVVATNRRQAATLVRQLVAYRGASLTPTE